MLWPERRVLALLGLALLLLPPIRAWARAPQLWPVSLQPRGFAYIDDAGNRRISGPFSQAAAFSEGMARAATVGRAVGFLDANGQWHIAPRFDDARDFHEGLAAVALRGPNDPYTMSPPWGFIDTAGKTAISLQFGQVADFREGLAAVTSRVDGAKWGFIDRGGTIVIAPQFDEVGGFIDGLARATTLGEDGSHVEGFIGRDGRWAIAPQYREVHDFTEGLAAVADEDERCGYIDTSGKIAIAAQYARCGPFHEGLARVQTAKGVAFIDHRGVVVLAGPFCNAGDFNGAMAPVSRKLADWRYVDRAGTTVFDAARARGKPKQRLALTSAQPFNGPLALVWTGQGGNATALWVDRKGQIVWRFHPSHWLVPSPLDPTPNP